MKKRQVFIAGLIAAFCAVSAHAAVKGVTIINTTSTNATLNEASSDVSGELVRVVFNGGTGNSVDFTLKSRTDGTTIISSTNAAAAVTVETNSVYFNGVTFGAGNAVTNGTAATAIVIYKE